MTDPILSEFILVQDFMPVLVTSKFDEVPIKNEQASLETPESASGSIWSKFKLVQDFMPVLVASLKKT